MWMFQLPCTRSKTCSSSLSTSICLRQKPGPVLEFLFSLIQLPHTTFQISDLSMNIPAVLSEFSSVQFSRSVVSDSLRPHESQHARPPSPSPTPGVHSDSCPSCQWCHPAISSSVVPFSSCPQSLPASESFPMSQLFSNKIMCWIFWFLFLLQKSNMLNSSLVSK